MGNDLGRRLTAEFIGTFWLVFGGCGAAIFASSIPQVGIGYTGVALAFGLTVLTMAYAVGHISGGHFNPAVTLGLWAAGRCANGHVVPYIIVQVVGAIVAAGALFVIASGKPDWVMTSFASNGFGPHSPGHYSMGAVFMAEAILTFIFLLVIIGATSKGAATGFAGIPIGLALTLIHLVSIPISNTSVNPARSTGPAIIAGGEYLGQLWLFWVAPILGAMIAGFFARGLFEPSSISDTVVVEERRVS